jgi:hypothetical protein
MSAPILEQDTFRRLGAYLLAGASWPPLFVMQRFRSCRVNGYSFLSFLHLATM